MAIPGYDHGCLCPRGQYVPHLVIVCISKHQNISEKKYGQDKYDRQGSVTVLYIHTAEKPIF